MLVDDHDQPDSRPLGLRYWMERVLEEIDRASDDFAPDPVHDLRVALRRCRSLARGFMAVDSDKSWKAMQQEGQRLFRRLGKLRDVQVSKDAVLRLGGPEDPVSAAVLNHLELREQELKVGALRALKTFDRDKWRDRIAWLHARTRRLQAGHPAFQLIALRAWTDAHELHRQALRNRSAASYHRLRIGIKKFRYCVENFLPLRHVEWGADLKEVQDCLGEAQDCRVLWETIARLEPFPDPAAKERWRLLVEEERARWLGLYRARMVGSNSLWFAWRQGLPPENRLRLLSFALVEKWAYFRGIDVARARRVRSLALRLHDGLRYGEVSEAEKARDGRIALHLAATLHELGRSKDRKKAHESALRRLTELPPLPGIPHELLELVAFVIRCHRGSFLDLEEKELKFLAAEQKVFVMVLAGVLRLARALDRSIGVPLRPIRFDAAGDFVVVHVPGYSEFGPHAEKVARARCHLEYALHRPIVVRGAREESETCPAGGSAEM